MLDHNSQLSDIISRYSCDQIYILVDENVSADLYQPFINAKATLRIACTECVKSLETVQLIWDFLFENGATRHALLINIGGGILTDIGGFAAATFKRGIDYVNIPTTLLAMVDAAHGGKTGVNYGGLKNQIGVFRQPVATIIDPDFLTTLDTRTFLSGYAELLKTALLDSNDFLSQAISFLEDYVSSNDFSALPTGVGMYPVETVLPVQGARDGRVPDGTGSFRGVYTDVLLGRKIKSLLDRAIAVKQRIVSADPEEHGLRAALNLGHTIGHAIEEMSNQSPVNHGYAVLYGLCAELYLSRLILPDADPEPLKIISKLVIDVYGKPTCSCRDYDQLIELMRSDKKNASADSITFTLLKKVGDPVINQVATTSQIREALDYLFSL